MEPIFDDLISAVKAPRKSDLFGIVLTTFAVLAIVGGIGAAIKSMEHTPTKLPAFDIGQVLHPGVV